MPVKLRDIQPNENIITSTLANEHIYNGVYREKLNARGFEQMEGFHYNEANIVSSVTNNMSIRIIMVLAIMASWLARILNFRGAFLKWIIGERG